MSNETIRKMLFAAEDDPASIKVIEHIEYDNFTLNETTYTGYDSIKPKELCVLEFDIEEDNYYLVNENSSELIYSFLDWVKGDDCLLVYNDQDNSHDDRILYRVSTVLPKGFSSNKLVRIVSLKRYVKKGSVAGDDTAHKEATAMASKSIIAGIHEAIDNQDMLLENTSVVNSLVDPISDASAQCVSICVYVNDNFQPVLTIEEYKALAALYSPNNKLLTSIQNA